MKAPQRKEFSPVPKGNHVARLYQIVHIGTVPTTFQGETRMTDKVRLTFELCNERKAFKEGEPEKPYSVSREFTFSMGKKSNLRAFVEGFGGTKLHDEEAYNFDIDKLLGEACLLNVVHVEKDGATYANIAGASPLPKGLEAPALYNEADLIDVNTASFDEIDALPEFLREKIKSSEEFAAKVRHQGNMEAASLEKPRTSTDDDEFDGVVPF
jgi:hypothetical protein